MLPQPQVAQQPAIPFGPFWGKYFAHCWRRSERKYCVLTTSTWQTSPPEAWLFESEQNAEKTVANLFKKRRDLVTDIRVWVQCYSSLAPALPEQYPQYIKHFLAYLSTVVGCSKRYKGLSWATYERHSAVRWPSRGAWHGALLITVCLRSGSQPRDNRRLVATALAQTMVQTCALT